MLEGVEDRVEILGVGQKSHDIKVIRPHEVEPAAREPVDPSDPKPCDVAALTDALRPGALKAIYDPTNLFRQNANIILAAGAH